MDETAAPEKAPETAVESAPAAADAAPTADAALNESATTELPTAAPPADETAAALPQVTESLGPDPLAKLEDDNSAFVLGMVPVIIVSVLALGCVALYFHRRRKNWNELDDVLKIDGGDSPIGHSHFTTKDMQDLEPTRPSKPLND